MMICRELGYILTRFAVHFPIWLSISLSMVFRRHAKLPSAGRVTRGKSYNLTDGPEKGMHANVRTLQFAK